MHNNSSETVKIWIENGILCGKYNIDAVDIATARELISVRIKASAGKDYPVLVDVTSVKSISKEAREILASGEGVLNMNACALIVGSPVNRLLGNFFLSVSKPKVPTKLFTSKAEAVNWLSQFVG